MRIVCCVRACESKSASAFHLGVDRKQHNLGGCTCSLVRDCQTDSGLVTLLRRI